MPDLITDELVLDLDTAIEYFGGAYPGPLLTELRTAVTGLRHPTLVPDFRPLVATGLAVDRQSPNGGITHQLADALQQSLDLIAALNAALIRAQEEIAARSAAGHPDDAAVDRFAIAMKAKLAKKRADGRGGWEGPDCTAAFLTQLLREHVEKGDPVDVGNLAMMLHQRGERIEP